MVVTKRNNFINDGDLSESTSLVNLLDRHNTESDEEAHILKHSPFYSEDNFVKMLSKHEGLCILDLNIQNIYAKFDEFESFVERVTQTNPISAICLNECWINEQSDLSLVQLRNYNMFYQSGSRVGHGHCGLVIYVHEQYQCKEITLNQESSNWDYLCIEFSHCNPNSKKYMLCNMYRIPGGTVDELNEFTEEFSSLLTLIKRMRLSAFICGDSNINLLQISNNQHFSTFFENVTSKGFFPRITLPTRLALSGNSNTLIDNIWTNILEENVNSKSGILINDISDHKMIFTYQEHSVSKEESSNYIDIEVQNNTSIGKFITELTSLNIYDQLEKSDNGNSQENYDIFSSMLEFAKDKHLKKNELNSIKKNIKNLNG